MIKLLLEPPEDTLVEFIVISAHEIPLDVKLDSVGGYGVIIGNLTDMLGEALLAIECAFAFAAGIGVRNEATVPPVGGNIK